MILVYLAEIISAIAVFIYKMPPIEFVQTYLLSFNFSIYFFIALSILLTLILFNLVYCPIALLRRKSLGFSFRFIIGYNLLSIAAIIGILVSTYVLVHPRLQTHSPEYNGYIQNYDDEVIVNYNIPIRIDRLQPKFSPELEGEWTWDSFFGIPNLTKRGRFKIKKYPLSEQRHVVYIPGVRKLMADQEHEYGFVFWTIKNPEVVSTYPAQGQDDVQRSDSFEIEFKDKNYDYFEWTTKITPEFEFTVDSSKKNKILITPAQALEQGVEYKLKLSARSKSFEKNNPDEVIEYGEIIDVLTLDFSTAKEPSIKEAQPQGSGILPDAQIRFEFEEDMDRQSVEERFSISPDVSGEIVWESDRVFIYKTESELPKETKFRTRFGRGIKTKNGGVVDNVISYEFETIGKVNVKSHTPANGEANVRENTAIRIEFDQEVNKKSAQERLFITPGVAGRISWEGNTMIYSPNSSLSLSTTYTVEVKEGVKSVHGLDGDTNFSFSFTTRRNIYLINLPIYYQPPGFACNLYTASMILAWKGSYVDPFAILHEIGYNDNRSGNSWTGNPYREYVGNSDATWGYGVYYPPIQQVLSRRGIQSEPRIGWNVRDIARNIEQGRVTIVWRFNGLGSPSNISWTANDGTYIPAFNGMHGSIVTGFEGPADNPTAVHINDPWLGRIWMTTAQFDAYWSYSNRMALLIY